MIKLRASLEAVKSRKNISDDVVQSVVLNVYGTADQMGELNALYRKPIEITIEVKP